MADDNMLTTIEGLVKLAKSQKKMQEQRTKLLSSLAETGMKKGMMNPFQKMMMQQYMQQQGGQQPGRQPGMQPTTQPGMQPTAPTDSFGVPTQEELYETSYQMTPTGPKQARKRLGYKDIWYKRIMKIPEEERKTEEKKFLQTYKFGKAGAGGINTTTQKALTKLQDAINEGTINTIEDAMYFIKDAESYYKAAGVDTNKLYTFAQEALPEKHTPGRGGFLGMGKQPERKQKYINGKLRDFEKKDNRWQEIMD